MKPKKFLISFLSAAAVVMGAVAAANYHLDYYGVFHPDRPVVQSPEINCRIVKMRYLLAGDHAQQYDSYLWGSSRVMKTDPRVAGDGTYNMGAIGGRPTDCFAQLPLVLQKNPHIRKVYLGVDDFAYTFDDKHSMNSALNCPYPTTFKDSTVAYSQYLFRFSLIRAAMKKPKGQTINMLHTTGTSIIPESIEMGIERQPDKHVQADKFKISPYKNEIKNEKNFSECLKTVKAVKAICDARGIQLVIFFNPLHMTTYLADDMDLMNRFKKELVKISSFWDFSGVNYVTANNYFWYETSHPRAFICDKILDIVSGQHKITWVPDFGVYVTPDNVDAFCEKAVRDRAAYDPDHEQWVPSAEERKIMTKRANYPW